MDAVISVKKLLERERKAFEEAYGRSGNEVERYLLKTMHECFQELVLEELEEEREEQDGRGKKADRIL